MDFLFRQSEHYEESAAKDNPGRVPGHIRAVPDGRPVHASAHQALIENPVPVTASLQTASSSSPVPPLAPSAPSSVPSR